MTTREHDDMQMAWAALAARTPAGPLPALDLALLAQFSEGRCDAAQRTRALALLAEHPEAWAIWKTLLAEQAEVAAAKAAPDAEPWWQRWFRPALLPRWGGGLATACLAVVVGVQFLVRTPTSLPALPPLAATLLDSMDSRLPALPLASSPYVRTARSGFIRPPVADDDAAFRAGFVRGQSAVAARLGGDSAEWRRAAEVLDQHRPLTCDEGDCGADHTMGIDVGVWASLTALRCATDTPPQADHALQALRSRSAALPASVPSLPDDAALACNYAARLMWRYGETL